MNKEKLAKTIDHTCLKPDTTEDDIVKLCEEVKDNQFRGPCVNPVWVKKCSELLKGTKAIISAVNDFPFGAGGKDGKEGQAQKSKKDGAHEIATVINVGAALKGDLETVQKELTGLKDILPTQAILSTVYWTNEQIKELTKAVRDAGVFCVKTSTGFEPKISLEEKARHVELMKKTAPDLLVNASADIKTLKDALLMLNAGADIISASAGAQIIEGLPSIKDKQILLNEKDLFDKHWTKDWIEGIYSNQEYIKLRRRQRGYWVTYLAGAIEDKKDHGAQWRLDITPKLMDIAEKFGIKITINDPCEQEKIKTGMGPSESKEKYKGWKRAGCWAQFHYVLSRIQEMDIYLVRDSDFLIVYFEKETGGTVCEMWDAYLHGIPIYVVSPNPPTEINSWILHAIKNEDVGRIFPNFTQLMKFLEYEVLNQQ